MSTTLHNSGSISGYDALSMPAGKTTANAAHSITPEEFGKCLRAACPDAVLEMLSPSTLADCWNVASGTAAQKLEQRRQILDSGFAGIREKLVDAHLKTVKPQFKTLAANVHLLSLHEKNALRALELTAELAHFNEMAKRWPAVGEALAGEIALICRNGRGTPELATYLNNNQAATLPSGNRVDYSLFNRAEIEKMLRQSLEKAALVFYDSPLAALGVSPMKTFQGSSEEVSAQLELLDTRCRFLAGILEAAKKHGIKTELIDQAAAINEEIALCRKIETVRLARLETTQIYEKAEQKITEWSNLLQAGGLPSHTLGAVASERVSGRKFLGRAMGDAVGKVTALLDECDREQGNDPELTAAVCLPDLIGRQLKAISTDLAKEAFKVLCEVKETFEALLGRPISW